VRDRLLKWITFKGNHLYKSHSSLLLLWLRVALLTFFAMQGENIVSKAEGWTDNPSCQSGAFDHFDHGYPMAWSTKSMNESSEVIDGSGSKIFDPGWVSFLCLGLGRVSHLWFGFEFGKFPLKTSNFSIFFPSDQKKISSGWVRNWPGWRRVGLFFTAGQK